MLPGMARKPRVVIVGAGNLGSALAPSLRMAGYVIESVIAHARGASLKKAEKLASKIGASAAVDLSPKMQAELVWFCVPDSEIARAARTLADRIDWKKKVVLHPSGALASDELDVLRRLGAAAASVHPLMTFVPGSRPSLAGVPFAVEGDAGAVRVARRIVRDLGGRVYLIRKQDKPAYHAWGMFVSPLFDALLATAEQVAAEARVPLKEARQRMIPILLQTLVNYAALGAPDAFSGPIVRGDVDTVRKHLAVLSEMPAAHDVYCSLALAALRFLPIKNRTLLQNLLASGRKRQATASRRHSPAAHGEHNRSERHKRESVSHAKR